MKTETTNFRRLVRTASSFEEAIQSLLDAGIKSRGRAILLARKHAIDGGKSFNRWMARRNWPRGSSVTQTL